MGEIVPFLLKNRREAENFSGNDINNLLKWAVGLQERIFGEERNGIFRLRGNFKELMTARICSVLLKKKMIRVDLFQCSLYLAQMMSDMMAKIPQSYYVVDYFIKGFEDKNPQVLREGADYCSLVCIFFEGRRGWRAMKLKDYERLGASLYLAYYDFSQRPIGWYMGHNFEEVIPIARRSVESLRN